MLTQGETPRMRLSELFAPISYLTLKLTRGCNLSCTYCNVEALTARTPKMSIEMFKRICDAYIPNSRDNYLGLEFHGGEPLLLGDDWFEEAVGYAREVAQKHRKFINFPLVTNGTMLTEERIRFLQKLGIELGTSCDGPPEINDELRGSGKAVGRAMKRMTDMGVPFGVIMVMSHSNYHRMGEVMDWFKTVGAIEFRINHLQPQGRGIDSQILTAEQMFEGHLGTLNHMVENKVSVFEGETYKMVHRFISGRSKNPPLSCWEHECQAGRTYLAMDLDGGIHLCGTDMTNHQIGSLDEGVEEEVYQQKLKRLHQKTDWVMRCFDCNAKRICNHSCPTSDYNSDIYKENSCQMTKMFWAHLCENPWKAETVEGIIRQRQQMRPAAVIPVSQVEMLGSLR